MKILWLSNKELMGQMVTGTGGWLDAMAEALLKFEDIMLGNIAFGNVSNVKRKDVGSIKQWIAPSRNMYDNLHSVPYLSDILRVIKEFSPDLIHVWGTESFWGLLTVRKYIEVPSLLGIQGLVGSIAKVYYGGLTIREQLACMGPKEIIKGSMIFQEARRHFKQGIIEREIINGNRFIVVQSEWVKAQVRSINNQCQLFSNSRVLRAAFYRSKPWQLVNKNTIFCTASDTVPWKGLHIALRAISILKREVQDIEIRIAGALQRKGIRQDGYVHWLNQQVKKLGISSNVNWLGGLNADQLLQEMLNSKAMILPTYLESFSNALLEAMMIGLPVAASYVGALPSIARDEETILFFPPGDDVMGAFQLGRLLTDHTLSLKISKNAREMAIMRNSPEITANKQYEIYKRIIEEY